MQMHRGTLKTAIEEMMLKMGSGNCGAASMGELERDPVFAELRGSKMDRRMLREPSGVLKSQQIPRECIEKC